MSGRMDFLGIYFSFLYRIISGEIVGEIKSGFLTIGPFLSHFPFIAIILVAFWRKIVFWIKLVSQNQNVFCSMAKF